MTTRNLMIGTLFGLLLLSISTIQAATELRVEKDVEVKNIYDLKQIQLTNDSSKEMLLDLRLLNNSDLCYEECYANIIGYAPNDVYLFDDLVFYDKNSKIRTIDEYNITTFDDKGKVISEKDKYKGNFRILIEGKKKVTETIDWVLDTMGILLIEWELWGGLDSEVYDDINDSSIDTNLWEQTIISTSGGGSNSWSEDASDMTIQSTTTSAAGINIYNQKVTTKTFPEYSSIKNITFRVVATAYRYDGGSSDDCAKNKIYVFGNLVRETNRCDAGGTTSDTSVFTVVRNESSGAEDFDFMNDGVYVSTFTATDSDLVFETYAKDDGSKVTTATTKVSYVYYVRGNSITLNSPADASTSDTSEITFNCSADATEGLNITNISLWTNSTGNWTLNETLTFSENNPTAIFNKTISTGIIWSCQAYDSNGESGFGENRTLNFDLKPTINIISPGSSVASNNVTMNFSITDDNSALDYCSYNVTTSGFGVVVADNEINCSNPIEYQTISDGVGYILTVFANDTTGNAQIETQVFNVGSAGTVVGGGGGAPASTASIIGQSYSCEAYREPLSATFNELLDDTTSENFSENLIKLWNAFWDASLCDSASSIVPIR